MRKGAIGGSPATRGRVDDHRGAADHGLNLASALEASLKAAVKPKVASDPQTRMLNCQTAQQLVARTKPGPRQAEELGRLLGRDVGVDAEFLDSLGAALLPQDQAQALHDLLLERYMRPNAIGSERQVAARTALRGFYQAKVKGRIPGFHQAGRMALG